MKIVCVHCGQIARNLEERQRMDRQDCVGILNHVWAEVYEEAEMTGTKVVEGRLGWELGEKNPYLEGSQEYEEWEKGWWDEEDEFNSKVSRAIEQAPSEALEEFQVPLETGDVKVIEVFIQKYS